MLPPDSELIEKARHKDKQAFTQIFDRYKNKILGYLYRYVGDYQLAEDLTVETFLSAYNNLDTYEERGIFSSWLYKIATNCAKKELRKGEHRKEVPIEHDLPDGEKVDITELVADDKSRPDYDARQNELKESVYRIMSKMDSKYKEVIMLCDVEGLEYSQAAKVLKCNPITVGTRLRRARKILYDILKKHGFRF